MKEQETGRPTLYSEEMLQKARDYIDSFNTGVVDKETDSMKLEVIPSISGLSLKLGVVRSTLYEWAKHNKAFSNTLDDLRELQETALLNGGLQGRFNANIAKLALANHNYSDKAQTDLTSSDGSMKQPMIIERVIIDPKDEAND